MRIVGGVNWGMHIAHSPKADLLTVQEIAEMTGLKRRQVAALARHRKIPGTDRPDGYHYRYRKTRELLDWIDWKRRRVAESRQLKASQKGHGLYSIHGMRGEFEIWVNKIEPQIAWNDELLEAIRLELSAIVHFHSWIVQMQNTPNASRRRYVRSLNASSPR